MKFFIHSRYGEILNLGVHLQNLGHEVIMYIPDHDYKIIGDGIIPKADNWVEYTGKGYTWVFDGCEDGKLQDWLRTKGEAVFGGTEKTDRLENNRQLGQKWFKLAGFKQPYSQNFKDFDSAIAFVQKYRKVKWVLKQNGNAPKSLNHMGKFDHSEDMLFHLKELKKRWSVQEFGEIDFDLQAKVEGFEVAASGFFNGKEFLKNKAGKIVGYINMEEKKEMDGDLGETCGELGTTFIPVSESNKLFKSILLRSKIVAILKEANFRGVFDINCIVGSHGITALEPTCRLGVPATSYEFIEGMKNSAEVIDAVARGKSVPVELNVGIGMVMCVVAKPFPLEGEIDPDSTSIGERLWILNGAGPAPDFSKEQKKHIHLYNFHKKEDLETKEIAYKVATKSGYMIEVTGRSNTVKETRENLIKYIDNNVYLPGQKYRKEIGKRVEEMPAGILN